MHQSNLFPFSLLGSSKKELTVLTEREIDNKDFEKTVEKEKIEDRERERESSKPFLGRKTGTDI